MATRLRLLLVLVLAPAVARAGQAPAEIPPAEAPPSAPASGPALAPLKLPPNPRVMFIPINDAETTRYGMIDPWQAGFVNRRLGEAQREQYDLVILAIDTGGGFVGSCERINKSVAECPVPVLACIEGNAFSGGALVAMGCRRIYMAPGTNIGGAQAVGLLSDLEKDQREKARSLLVATVRGLSEKHGFPPAVAQAMVDSEAILYETDLKTARFLTDSELADWKQNEASRGPAPRVVSTWKDKGQILTLTARQAYDCGMAAAVVTDRGALFATLGVKPGQVYVARVPVAEKVGRFLGHPLLLILLVVVAVVALVYELKTGGHGLGYLLFGFCMGLFFWLTFLADSAGAPELILFLLGAVLLAVELFVLPGFGVTGVAGIACLLVSIALAFIPAGSLPSLWKEPGQANPFQEQLLYRGMAWAALALFSVLALVVMALLFGVRLPGIGRLALYSTVGAGARMAAARAEAGPESAPPQAPPELPAAPDEASLLGQEGVAETVLRPAGKVRLGGISYDATAEGAWIESGRKVRVLEVRATGLLVREA